jgi:methanogenic corrinoid protein MtbC1
MPGDQHSFGTVVIDELFCREGWMTDRMSEASTPDLLERVAGEWFDLIGLTITCDYHMGPLPGVITALRNVSRNPNVCVMVGGRMFFDAPDRAIEVGADGTAPDAKVALEVAARLVGAFSREAIG